MGIVGKVTVGVGVGVAVIGTIVWIRNRNAAAAGPAKSQAAVASQMAATSAGKSGSHIQGQTQVESALALFTAGMNAVQAARNAAEAPGS